MQMKTGWASMAHMLLMLTNLEGRMGSKYMEEKVNELQTEVLLKEVADTEDVATRLFSLYTTEREVLFEEWKEDFNKNMEAHVRQIWSMARGGQCTYEDAFKYVVKMFSDVPEEVEADEAI